MIYQKPKITETLSKDLIDSIEFFQNSLDLGQKDGKVNIKVNEKSSSSASGQVRFYLLFQSVAQVLKRVEVNICHVC